jgi:hypothetical protein
MPNDAKLGLMVGVGLVVVIGFVFFRKEPATANPEVATPAAVNSKESVSSPPSPSQPLQSKTKETTPEVPVSAPAPTAIPVSTTPPS